MTDTSAAFDDYNLPRPEFFTMTTITILSNEIIDIILQQETVGIQDVVNFGLTCKRFLSVLDHNTLWQRKLYQRWPYLKKIYNKRIQNKEIINFKDDVKASIKCRNELRCYLSLMSERLHRKNLSNIDLEHFNVLHSLNMDAHIMNYYFLTDELIYLVTMLPSALLHNCDLTHRYYGKILLPCLQQQYLKKVWQEFVNYPKEQQLLERAATIVAQWYQPQKRIFYLDVEASLDNITQQVLEDLKKIHREHPIFSTSAKQFSFWKHNINGNQWNKKEERQIIDVIRTVLFDELGFHSPVSQTDILIPKSDDILIDCVLESKVGNAISLTIVFQSIARRLGVRCDLISFPTHFFLSWKPKCNVKNPKDEEYFYIDVLHNGAIRSSNDCPRTRGRRCPIDSFNVPNEISPIEMVLRMIDQLCSVRPNYQHHQDRTLQIRSLLEFRYMIEPYNIDTIEMLGSHYIRYQMSLSGLITTLQRILDSYSDRTSMEAGRAEMTLRRFEMHAVAMTARRNCIAPKERSKKIKYAVGMIVCNRSSYWGTGVIIDWDEKYNSEVDLIPEYRILRDHSRPDDITLTQPFYTILSENGRTYYAAEDSLIEAHPPRSIDHNEIGRYFCRFARTHYVPNKILTTYYPHDLTILNTLRMPEHLH